MNSLSSNAPTLSTSPPTSSLNAMTIDDVGIATGIPAPVSARVTRLGGRKVMWIEFDASEVAHPLSSQMTAIISEGLRAALDELIPIVLIVNSSGADIAEGVAPLHGWGTAARLLTKCSGRVPTFAIVDGPAVSGPALLLGLVDVVIMTSTSYAFVNGPLMIRQFTGVDITKDELGSASTMERSAGLATAVVETREEGRDVIVEILNYLPDRVDAETPRLPTSDPINRLTPEAGDHIPETATGSYDVRSVVESIVDDGVITEIRSQWALNIVTAFASIDGRPVGIVANQPMALAGTLDIPASQKAARFVNFCDAFNLPIITFVDTPGFYPGKDLEWRGMIRHGAQLVYAYGQATVPRICVILRKSYGGAYIVMDSKRMGNDVCLAWPWAELAVMGAGQASAILRRGASDDDRIAFESDYTERLLNPYIAAERGYVDDVIDPADTRATIAASLSMLSNKRDQRPHRRHGNSPL